MTLQEAKLLGPGAQEVSRSQDCLVVRQKGEDGDRIVTVHRVFPGIDLVYTDVHAPRMRIGLDQPLTGITEIEYCREGRIECTEREEYFYLTPGDIALLQRDGREREVVFPLRHYHGISILIDHKRTPRCLACMLDGVDVDPEELVRRFRLAETGHLVLRQLPAIRHIFAELERVPLSIQKGYFKIKVLEVLLFLSSLVPEQDARTPRRFSRGQVELAKEMGAYLAANLESRPTIGELSRRFGASPTQIKEAFRGVYGTSIQSYVREIRMREAGRLLRDTDRTVLDVAAQFGYSNASKFAAAFQSVMGVSPARYRTLDQVEI